MFAVKRYLELVSLDSMFGILWTTP